MRRTILATVALVAASAMAGCTAPPTLQAITSTDQDAGPYIAPKQRWQHQHRRNFRNVKANQRAAKKKRRR